MLRPLATAVASLGLLVSACGDSGLGGHASHPSATSSSLRVRVTNHGRTRCATATGVRRVCAPRERVEREVVWRARYCGPQQPASVVRMLGLLSESTSSAKVIFSDGTRALDVTDHAFALDGTGAPIKIEWTDQHGEHTQPLGTEDPAHVKCADAAARAMDRR